MDICGDDELLVDGAGTVVRYLVCLLPEGHAMPCHFETWDGEVYEEMERTMR